MYDICIFISVLQILPVQSAPAPTHLQVTRVGPCNDFPGAKITVSELGISTQTYDSTLSGQLNITEDIENGWRIKATMLKCQDIRNTDTCDYFKSFILVKNGCEDEDDVDAEFYSMLFHYAYPRLECPVRAGVYSIAGYPFFTEDNYLMVSESKISTSIFGYTYKLNGFTPKGQRIFCIEAYLQLLYIREHDWTINRTVKIETTPTPEKDHSANSEEIIDPEENNNEKQTLKSDEENNKGTANVEGETNKSEEDRFNENKANDEEEELNEDDKNASEE